MKIDRLAIEFNGRGIGIRCFYRDIFRLGKHRNVLFFLKQLVNGIKLEVYITEFLLSIVFGLTVAATCLLVLYGYRTISLSMILCSVLIAFTLGNLTANGKRFSNEMR